MTPQPWFLLAGLLFIVAVIAGAALLVTVAWIALRVLALGLHADQPPDPDPEQGGESVVVLAQLLAELAAAHQHHQQPEGWDQPPVVVDITAISPQRRGEAER